MMNRLTTALALSAALLCAATGAHAQAPALLTGQNGMTLYVFDKDPASAGKSVCNGPCATNWPPLLAQDSDSASGDWTVFARDDGKKQWAFKGKPLYFWAKDQKPGDQTGEGVNGVWHIARP